ncbi:MAG: sigma 54-interacting transcriptional regulator [Gemmataceae bacterium]|jgi:Nif-specific regulatory protein|nr:sigma 54-interacting transcriptional regulator [Gemmataceae bacterium]
MAKSPAAYLVAYRQDGQPGDVTALHRGTIYTLGRAPKNRILLPDDSCSRQHAEIFFADGEWYVRDLNSRNGTKLNNQVVRKDQPLENRDRLEFGHFIFEFVTDLQDVNLPLGSLQVDRLQPTNWTDTTKFIAESDDSGTQSDAENTVPDPTDQERTLTALYTLALKMGQSNDVERLIQEVLRGLLNGVPAQQAAIVEVNGREIVNVWPHSRDGKLVTFHKSSQLATDEVLDRKQAMLAINLQSDPRYAVRDSIRDLRAGSLICAPILLESENNKEKQIRGLLHLYATADRPPLTRNDLDFAVAVAKHLGLAWSRILREKTLDATNRELANSLRLESELVGNSPALKAIESKIARVAATSATVLIRGESGSGKELVARALHFSSPRRDAPFVTLNCAAITESLLESELFGHEKGAYTGATEKMIGKFEAANGGTIFLDEIGEMPLTTQSKFLRVLEGHPFERLGGNNLIKVNVRVVAATNRPLEEAVREGSFRKDLFYRLQVVEIHVPPLRERLADVPILAEHFLKKFSRETGRKFKGFTPDAIQKMTSYHWPGNVRELRNVIERAVALSANQTLDANDILLTSLEVNHPPQTVEIYKPISLEELEKRHILDTLIHTDWNKSKAAEILGIERSTLDRKIKSYGIKKES